MPRHAEFGFPKIVVNILEIFAKKVIMILFDIFYLQMQLSLHGQFGIFSSYSTAQVPIHEISPLQSATQISNSSFAIERHY